ncbi:MAG: hypothetical protein GY841_15820 [FCB group bacterium]|nr:hypothetical protein [FCB group bacterium]
MDDRFFYALQIYALGVVTVFFGAFLGIKLNTFITNLTGKKDKTGKRTVHITIGSMLIFAAIFAAVMFF